MEIVFYSLILNNHQANVADELWELTGHQYCFVELANLQAEHKKGDTRNYGGCPYLLRAWESDVNWKKAMEMAKTAECCVFGGVHALPFQKERMKLGLLSFEMSERWLKRGMTNLFTPAICKMFFAYWIGGWNRKPLYKLCCSAYSAKDHSLLRMYRGKCYKWGYFTSVLRNENQQIQIASRQTRLMWCARFIDWKHPEIIIECAKRLKAKGFDFKLNMYGDGPLRQRYIQEVESFGLETVVCLKGNVPNNQIFEAMRESDIFILTSDKNEGWGAVINEAMTEGCLVIGSDEIGSIPYLIKDNNNGLIFKSGDVDSLYEKIVWSITNSNDRARMQAAAIRTMQDVWSPRNAAMSLLQLIEDIKNGKESSITEGPCSKA